MLLLITMMIMKILKWNCVYVGDFVTEEFSNDNDTKTESESDESEIDDYITDNDDHFVDSLVENMSKTKNIVNSVETLTKD